LLYWLLVEEFGAGVGLEVVRANFRVAFDVQSIAIVPSEDGILPIEVGGELG
jgi:hypothetical protein